TLNAIGTVADSITFTSNSGSPTPGIWSSIFLNNIPGTNFNYCNFRYASWAVYGYNYGNNLNIRNSAFNYNNSGFYSASWGTRGNIDSCNFSYNTNYGIRGWWNIYVDQCRAS